MRISAKGIFTACLALALAGCASVEVTTPAGPAVPEPEPQLAHWRFDDTRPPADHDGYRPPRRLAVLLPMTGQLATAAASVRDGLLAGYYGERRQRPELVFYDTGGTPAGTLAAHARALAEGADQILGPLGRDEVSALLHAPSDVPLLALNNSDAPLPLNVAGFALSPEDEGAAIATYLAARNARRVLVLSNGDDSAVRAIGVLRRQLEAAGGGIAATLAVTGDGPVDLTDSLRTAAAGEGGIDATVLALRGPQARMVAPQLSAAGLGLRLRIATSQITSGTGRQEEDHVLDGIVFPGETWTLGGSTPLPSAASLAGELPTARGPAARLFAFGYDAWLLSGRLQHLAGTRDASLEGATGILRIDADGNVRRTPAWAVWSNGTAILQPGN